MSGACAIAWSREPIIAARLGMREDMREILSKHAICSHKYPLYPDFDHELGIVRPELAAILSAAVNEALMQSHHGLIQLFPAWPDGWDARFSLLGEGNVLVEAEKTAGEIKFAAFIANRDAEICVLNPWPGQEVACVVNGKSSKLAGERIKLVLKKGRTALISPAKQAFAKLSDFKITPRAGETKTIEFAKGDKKYQAKLGLTAEDRLPRELPPTKLPIGPIGFANPADVVEKFIAGWYGNPFLNATSWSEKFGGSMCILGKAGLPGAMKVTYSSQPTGLLGPEDDLSDIVMEADFIPEATPAFGFFCAAIRDGR